GDAGNYAYNFNGTSAATPIVSGVVALMLQANPGLGYRDVQEILAYSARFVDAAGKPWRPLRNSGSHRGGAAFSRHDAHAAVRLAESYKLLNVINRTDANVQTVSATSESPRQRGGTFTFNLKLPAGISLEHIDLTLQADIANASRVSVFLTSPSSSTQ